MRAFQIDFERGFALHYPDGMDVDKGLVFVFHKIATTAWSLYLDTDGDVRILDITPPSELHVPTGAIGRAWHGHGLEAVLGFALDAEPAPFDGHLKRIESQGWVVENMWGMVICCLEKNAVPERWEWVGICGDCPFCSLKGECPMLET